MKNAQKQLLKYLEKQIAEFHKYSKKIQKKAGRRSVHQLRLSVRRIRLVLWLLKHDDSDIPVKKLNRELDELGVSLGSLRELQVAIRDAKAYGLSAAVMQKRKPRKSAELKKKIEELGRRRLENEIEKLRRKLKNEKGVKLKKAFENLLYKTDKWKSSVKTNTKDIHQLRKDLKKAHYFLTAFNKKYPELEDLVSTLGRVHDLDVLMRMTGSKKNQLKKEHSSNIRKAMSLKTRVIPAVSRELSKQVD